MVLSGQTANIAGLQVLSESTAHELARLQLLRHVSIRSGNACKSAGFVGRGLTARELATLNCLVLMGY